MSASIVGNRYELLEKIGSGGMAIVYKARCRLLNRYVAIKMLRAEFNEDAEFLKRFETEAQAAASLSHPNIVSVYDVGIHNKLHYIVMEYVEGITLKDYLVNNGPLPIEKIIDFAGQISSALEHAHAKKIIHHDIKPHNILITDQGRLKVTDFGLARAASASTTIAGVEAIGSVHYASPEQARGGFTDEKSDIYSLGVTMYEMTTGRVPFTGETPVSVAIKHLQKEPTPPSAIAPDVPPALETIILKSMEKEPIKRYQSAVEVTAAIRGVLEHDVVMKNNIEEEDDKSATRRMPSPEEIIEEEKKISQIEEKEEEIEPPKKENNLKEDSGKKRKEDTIAIVAAIATTLVIAAALIAILVNMLGGGISSKMEVPDFTGITYEEAMEMAKKYSLELSEKDREFSDTVEADKIISQTPEAGTKVSKGEKIAIVISKGKEIASLKDYKNDNVEDVEKALDRLGIDYEIKEISDDEIEEGKVIKTEPKAGSKISEKDIVTIYVSVGPEKTETEVPDLSGETLANAKTLLLNRGLGLGNISYVDSNKPKDTVIQQTPNKDSKAASGDKVDLVLSRGPASTPEPSSSPEPSPSTEPSESEENGDSGSEE